MEAKPFYKLEERLQDYIRSWMYSNTEDYAQMVEGKALEQLSFKEIGDVVGVALKKDLEIVTLEIENNN